MIEGRNALRALAVQRCLTGAVLLIWPDRITRVVAGRQRTPPAWIVRVLGARLATQGVIEIVRPYPRVAIVGAAIDATHAASMIATAALLPAYRRTAAVSAGEATFAAAIAWVAVRAHR